jgi:hypothetical protein
LSFWKNIGRVFLAVIGLVSLVVLVLEWQGVFSFVRFTRERIEIILHPHSFEVIGTYMFENPLPWPWLRGLRFPIPVDADHPAPAEVEVLEILGKNDIGLLRMPVRLSGNEARFSIKIQPQSAMSIRIRYTQSARDGNGIYILNTTKKWGRPLDHGDYLLIPDGVKITASNYPLQGTDVLSFSRDHFMPEHDWIFSWTPEAKP